jgi:hypothetical protein
MHLVQTGVEVPRTDAEIVGGTERPHLGEQRLGQPKFVLRLWLRIQQRQRPSEHRIPPERPFRVGRQVGERHLSAIEPVLGQVVKGLFKALLAADGTVGSGKHHRGRAGATE